MASRAGRLTPSLVLAGLLASGCYDFHLTGPEDAAPVPNPRLVSVTIVYRQPNGCLSSSNSCHEPVVFFGSWMQKGVTLKRDAGDFIWRGVVDAVPVNFPPRDDPYKVTIRDPYLLDSDTAGFTANRLTVGGQLLSHFDSAGGPLESALVYIDENGQGHNPF